MRSWQTRQAGPGKHAAEVQQHPGYATPQTLSIRSTARAASATNRAGFFGCGTDLNPLLPVVIVNFSTGDKESDRNSARQQDHLGATVLHLAENPYGYRVTKAWR